MSPPMENIFNHLVLPPKLPGRQDPHLEDECQDFIKRLLKAVDTLYGAGSNTHDEALTSLGQSLRLCSTLNRGRLDKATLLPALQNLRSEHLILHIVEQNAALLIRRHTSSDGVNSIVFEAFEASAPSEQVLASENALCCEFPSRACAITEACFFAEAFQENLTEFLEKASMETLSRLVAHSRKANVQLSEFRDVTSPALITQMLMPLLETLGQPLQVPRIRKRVRDDVNIEFVAGEGAGPPFRRHPFWLVLRVAVQRQLCLSLGAIEGRVYYKFIISTALAHLSSDVVGKLRPELTLVLRSKLSRRMAKLEQEREQHDLETNIYDRLFESRGPWFQSVLQSVTNQISIAWADFKSKTTRRVERIPAWAVRSDLRLSLPNTGKYLDHVSGMSIEQKGQAPSLASVEINDEGMRQVQIFTERYFQLAEMEKAIENNVRRHEHDGVSHAQHVERCMELAGNISDYFDQVGPDCYASNPDLMSTFILNIFDLWIIMDAFAIRAYPLLGVYHPVFTPELFDCLQLPNAGDFARLRKIQQYLHERIRKCRFKSQDLFTAVESPDSFASMHLARSSTLQDLKLRIMEASNEAREEKQEEWGDVVEECEELSERIAELACLCTFAGENGKRTNEDIRSCKKCFYWRKRNRLEIKVHEDFLPSHSSKAAGIVFELGIPPGIESYRNVTFRIICLLWPVETTKASPPLFLKDFRQLRNYKEATSMAALGGITLASQAKSFLQTHWEALRVKRCSLRDVVLPHAPQFRLFDSDRCIWIDDIDRQALTLQHLCGVFIPKCLETTVLPQIAHPPAVFDGPTSYAVIANHRECPQHLSPHEFSAYQRLLSGTSRRWMNILVELASSNLNFSSNDTVQLLSQLAVQAGPENDSHRLREAYMVFGDPTFCYRLANMVEHRLDGINLSWREANCMDLCVTLLQRLSSFATPAFVRRKADNLIKRARGITLQWISRLRVEVRDAKEGTAAARIAEYAFKAAVLCRRTFALTAGPLAMHDVRAYCEASIALQENMPGDFQNNSSLRAMLIRDTRMAWSIRTFVGESIVSHFGSLAEAISNGWMNSDRSSKAQISKMEFLNWTALEGHCAWVAAHFVTSFSTCGHSFSPKQTVHFNYVEGFLLVDGKPLGKLPSKISQSAVVKELFPSMHLRTYPSMLDGMTHQLSSLNEGNVVHFGMRGEEVVVRAMSDHGLLEFIPRRLFSEGGVADLPASLLDNCTHWLNLSTACLEVRRKPTIWRSRPRNWTIDLRGRECRRGSAPNGVSRLLDPQSQTAQRVAKVFEHFERPEQLTIYQPSHGRLTVDVNTFELSFRVNRTYHLEERKLGKEIDENQDAGCLYGLSSKLVLRDTANQTKRSVIVPLGKPRYRRVGMHVEVTLDSSDAYATFEIDETLGRLTCPPEPGLVYHKACVHALTSFPLPDPLTGRTGTEEAVQILQSGTAQPWLPLSVMAIVRLKRLASLSPRREFYPKDKRSLQIVEWIPHLSVTIQHERLEFLAQNLLRISHRLQPFYLNTLEMQEVDPPSHLRIRGEIHRSKYEPRSLHPQCVYSTGLQSSMDRVYSSTDYEMHSESATNVIMVAETVFRRQFGLRGEEQLRKILEGHRVIGGFQQGDCPPTDLSKLVDDDVIEQFGQLIDFSRKSDPAHLCSVAFRLCLLAFQPQSDVDLLQVLAAFARVDALKVIAPPPHAVFIDFNDAKPTTDSLEQLIRPIWPEFRLNTRKKGLNHKDAADEHLFRCDEEGRRLARWFIKQWPAARLSVDDLEPELQLLDKVEAVEAVMSYWNRLVNNLELRKYVDKVQGILNRYYMNNDVGVTSRPSSPDDYFTTVTRPSPVIPSLPDDLLKKDLQQTSGSPSYSTPRQLVRGGTTPAVVPTSPAGELTELSGILDTFAKSNDATRSQYGKGLKNSLSAVMRKAGTSSDRVPFMHDGDQLFNHIPTAINQVRTALECQGRSIMDAFVQNDRRAVWLQLGYLWPCTTKVALLEQLRSTSQSTFGPRMRESLIKYAIMTTHLQWFLRLWHAFAIPDKMKIQEALASTGHENWDPMDFPDWILIELEGDFLIRPNQVDVAKEIISPSSGVNSVLQMNMGQGKTSCIVPMAMSVLGSDQSQITRLIVPKALVLQTAQVVQSRIGGLVGREIRHIPFSRRTPSTIGQLRLYSELHKEVRQSGGTILTTSDHLLSYKLSGLQRLLDSKPEEARFMIGFQEELTKFSRDVIDESDFTLAVKTQLIYPSGPQIHVDGAPQRWTIAEALISLVEDHLPALPPRGVEIMRLDQARGSFPMMHFLKQGAEDELHRLIIDDICNGRTTFLRPTGSGTPPEELRKHIRQLLSETSLKKQNKDGLKKSASMFADPEHVPKTLLLVRGLLLNRILLLCLKKRWNVQYGLHPGRDPIAVPYEAKGVPSENSEFGHPDVAIILTILSFYYGGLSQAQFRQSLGHVLKSDDPAAEFDRWTNGCDSLPASLRTWSVINIDDVGQINELWAHLRLHREVLNHFMNNFVFPAHAKQFTMKSSASAWDIPGYPKPHKSNLPGARTTGFSGTKDNETLLPMTIRQNDLPSLAHTNAEVLSCLLQPRNRQYRLAAWKKQRMTEEKLLGLLHHEGIRVLIDAGAYILESSNEALVKKWLDIDTKSKAAVFFAADNRAWVLYRGSKCRKVPLVTTPFANNLTECLVFLDEAHCRGTDLKLPHDARGALTLALGQTKDHTVQAAMRLRQLATTQSVGFFAPPEVDQSIRDVCKLQRQKPIDSAHVITWLLEQTCRTNEQLANLYLAQGVDYCRRTDAQWANHKFLTNDEHRSKLLNVIQQQERQSLEQQYGPVTDTSTKGSADELFSGQLKDFMSGLTTRRRAMPANTKGHGTHSSALEEVEQEREVEFQVEEVRHVQKQKRYEALKFPGLHPSIQPFVCTGKLAGHDGYMHAFDSLQNTVIGQKYGVKGTGSRFFVTKEFSRTVLLRKEKADNFLRPVEWILWCPSSETALLIIPEEAELVIPMIRRYGQGSPVHLITYAAPVTKGMLSAFNDLGYYSIPSLPVGYKVPTWFSVELGIFAGRLYVTPEECALVARYLEGPEDPSSSGTAGVTAGNAFARNPMGFLREWLPLRRQVSDVMQTPMGYIIQGRLHALHPDHAFFVTRAADSANGLEMPVSNGNSNDTSNDVEDFSDMSEVDDEGWDDLGGDHPGTKVKEESVDSV